MNQKISPKAKQLAIKIFSISLDICTDTPHDVYVNHRGHVDYLNVEVWENGFSYEKNDNHNWENINIPLDNEKKLAIVLERLEKMYKESKLN